MTILSYDKENHLTKSWFAFSIIDRYATKVK